MSSPSIKSRFAKWLLADETKSASISGITNPESWLTELFGSTPAQSGINVNPATAMQCAPVYRAVTLIATSIGNLPVKVYRRLEQGKEADSSHPAYGLVHDDATEWLSASKFRELITTDALLHGEGFALVSRDGEQRPVELIYLPPGNVTVKADDLTSEPYYLIGASQARYSFRDVLHVTAPCGAAPVKTCKEAIGLALVLERHAARLFGNGARPGGVLSIKDNLDDTTVANIRSAWNATFGGGKSGGTAILPGNAEYQPLTFNSVDAQFAEMRAFQIGEIARAFGVPPILLQDYSRATWSNSETMGRMFVQFTLLPWLQAWEAAYRRTLLSPDERSSHLIEFNTDALLKADYAARIEGYAKQISARMLSPNEARAAENMPPYAGGDAFVNPNTMTAGTPATTETPVEDAA